MPSLIKYLGSKQKVEGARESWNEGGRRAGGPARATRVEIEDFDSVKIGIGGRSHTPGTREVAADPNALTRKPPRCVCSLRWEWIG